MLPQLLIQAQQMPYGGSRDQDKAVSYSRQRLTWQAHVIRAAERADL